MKILVATSPAPTQAPARAPWLDAVRGLALVAMALYHFTWDLAYFGLIDARTPYWLAMRVFGGAIAATFLSVSGVSLALSAKNFRPKKFWRRWAQIFIAALFVTAVSLYIDPAAPIFFGILHCIALASLLASPGIFSPWIIAAGMGIAVAVTPVVVSSLFPDSAANSAILTWAGLSAQEPRSADFRPFFPWAAFLFAGLAFARAPWGAYALAIIGRWRASGVLARALRFGGRHSLVIYLIHQPILMGLIAGFLSISGISSTMQEADFLSGCVRQCVLDSRANRQEQGDAQQHEAQAAPICARACACIAQDLRSADLWTVALARRLDSVQTARAREIAQSCAASQPYN